MGLDYFPIGIGEIREITSVIGRDCEEQLGKPNIPSLQLNDPYVANLVGGSYSGEPTPPSLQEMTNMNWQALALGATGFFYYSFLGVYLMDKITPMTERWKDIIEFTEQLWKYKDIVLSIDKVNKIKYVQNINITFEQRKYNNSNYIFLII